MFALFVFNLVLLNHVNKIPLAVTAQCRFAKMRIIGNKIIRLHKFVSEIATAATRHQDFLADFVGLLQYQHAPTLFGGGCCAKQAGGTCAEDYYVVIGEGGLIHWIRICIELNEG
jgi:hypothetical protein